MIHFASHKHTPLIRSLWKQVFLDTEPFLDLYFNEMYKPQQTVVSIEGDVLCATMQLLPYSYKGVKGAYVFAVITHPEKRKQGHMSRMFIFAAEELKNKGIAFLFLIPQTKALFSMYRKMGFYDAFKQSIVDVVLPLGNVALIAPDTAALFAFYQRVHKGKDLMLHSKEQLEFHVRAIRLEGGTVWAIQKNGSIAAACFVVPVHNELRILDLFSLNNEAEKALLCGLAKQYQCKKAKISSINYPSSSQALGMVKILDEKQLSINELQNTYLSLMMNE